MALDTTALGQPVEIGQIARALKQLWDGAGGVESRASLVNFAVLCRGAEALDSNTKLISGFTKEHACRALLLARVEEEGAPAVRAWINVHCHLSRAGAKQVCCEQITFVVDGASDQLVSNVLFANLDSDLPLYLWWQGELSPVANEQLWSRVDRLIYDSREWDDVGAQVALLRQALHASNGRMVPCDLNWTRTLHLRQAVAQMFDQPGNLALLSEVKRVTLRHAPRGESTALLLIAWISAQLGWTLKERTEGRLLLLDAKGDEIVCEVSQGAGAAIELLEIEAVGGAISIQRNEYEKFFHVEVRAEGRPAATHLLPASSYDLVTLLDEELTLGGRHRVYLKALAALEPMLTAEALA